MKILTQNMKRSLANYVTVAELNRSTHLMYWVPSEKKGKNSGFPGNKQVKSCSTFLGGSESTVQLYSRPHTIFMLWKSLLWCRNMKAKEDEMSWSLTTSSSLYLYQM